MSQEGGNDSEQVASKTVFQAEEIPQLQTEQLADQELAAIERAVMEREQLISSLNTDILEVRSERDALQNRVAELESTRQELQERIQQLSVERPQLEPRAVFADLGQAINDVQDDLAETNYRIGDVEFNLKTNVTQTDQGLRMHMPSVDETFASQNLSEVRFRVQADTAAEPEEADMVELPDLSGLARSTAEQQLSRKGLQVGDITEATEPDEPAGRVIDQFPEPYSLVPEAAAVDLTVVAEQTDTLRAEFRQAIEERELSEDAELTTRLREADVADLESLSSLHADEIAEITGLPVEDVIPLREQLLARVEPGEPENLEMIPGIGPTYAERLRAGGIESPRELAGLSPEEVAEIAEVSEKRTERWIHRAESHLGGEYG